MEIPYQQFYQLSDTPMCVLDPEGNFVSLNAAMMQMIGDTGESKPRLVDWWSPSDRNKLSNLLKRHDPQAVTQMVWGTVEPSHSRPMKMQWRIVHLPDNAYFFVEAHPWSKRSNPADEEHGMPPKEVHDTSKAVDTLEHFQDFLKEAVAQLAEGLGGTNYAVCLHDPETAAYLYMSPAIETLMGRSASELYGKTPYSFFHPDDLSKLALDHRNKQKGEVPIQHPLRFRRQIGDGSYRHTEALSRPIVDHEGRVIFIVSITRDAGVK